MKANIKFILSLLGSAVAIISLLLVLALIDIVNQSKELRHIEYNRFALVERANELKQSSDDLTK